MKVYAVILAAGLQQKCNSLEAAKLAAANMAAQSLGPEMAVVEVIGTYTPTRSVTWTAAGQSTEKATDRE